MATSTKNDSDKTPGNADSAPPGGDNLRDDPSMSEADRQAEAARLEEDYRSPAIADDDRNTNHNGDASTRADQQEQRDLAPTLSENEENGSGLRKKIKTKISGKVASVGVGAGLFVGTVFTSFGILQGPLQVIHFSQLIQQFHLSPNIDFSARRAIRTLWKYRTGEAERSRLGALTNRAADRAERRMRNQNGLESRYDRRGNLIGFRVLDQDKAAGFLDDFKDKRGISVNDDLIDINEAGLMAQRRALRAAMRPKIPPWVPGGYSMRLQYKRSDLTLHPLRAVKKRTRDSILDFYERRKEERALKRRYGNAGSFSRRTASGSDSDGDSDNLVDSADRANTPNAVDRLKNRFLGVGTKLGPAFALLVAFVELVNIGEDIQRWQYAHQVLPTLRTAAEIAAAGDQIRAATLDYGTSETTEVTAFSPIGVASAQDSGDQDQTADDTGNSDGIELDDQIVTWEEIGSLVDDFDKEMPEDSPYAGETLNWSAGKSVQAESGQEPTGPDLAGASQLQTSGHKPKFWQDLDFVLNNGPFVVLEFIRTVGDAALNIGESLVSALLPDAVEEFLASLVPDFVDQWLDSMFAIVAGRSVCVTAQGPELGNCGMYGGRMLANDQAVSQGATALSAEDEFAIKKQIREDIKYQQSQKSIASRLFDIKDANSVASNAMRNIPSSPKHAIASLFNAPREFASSLISPATADSHTDFDYGFPAFGYTLDEQYDRRFANPYANAVIVEEDLPRLNEKYGDCFGTKAIIDGDTLRLEVNGPDQPAALLPYSFTNPVNDPRSEANCEVARVLGANTENPGEVKQAAINSEEFLRYRFFLADTIAALGLVCYIEQDEDACTQIHGGAIGPADGGVTTTPEGLVEGTPEELAQTILDSANIELKTSDVQSQIRGVANGTAVNQIDPVLLQVLATLGQNHKYSISSLRRCTPGIGAGTASRHCTGHAADISGSSGIDGQVFGYGGQLPKIQAFLDDAALILPAGSEIGVPNSFYVNSTSDNTTANTRVFVDKGTAPHIHLGVPR